MKPGLDFNPYYLEKQIAKQERVAAAAELSHTEQQTQASLKKKYEESNRLLRLQRRLDVVRNQHMPLMESLGIGSIEIQSAGKDITIDLDTGSREVRVLDLFPFSPADFNRLLLASGQLTLATGDQSWSQAVSADKTILYERSDHKRQLVASWQQIGRQKLAGLDMQTEVFDAFMQLADTWYEANRVQIKGAGAQGAAAIQEVFRHGATYALDAASKTVNAAIRQELGAASSIVSAVKAAIHARPAGAATAQLLEQIKSGKVGFRGSVAEHTERMLASLAE